MAYSLHPIHHHHHHTPLRQRLPKPTTITFSLSTTTTTSSSSTTPFPTLHHHLTAQNFRLADEETRRLIIDLSGPAAKSRGYVFFSEVQFILPPSLLAIDSLWRDHSHGRFGYSVQKRIWDGKCNRDFTSFFKAVGWMKRLEGSTEVEQYNYRAFPDEFVWELDDKTPLGHLPLTNALRGTQLLNSIFLHPAFDGVVVGENEDGGEGDAGEVGSLRKGLLLKPNYSF
ncbi:hypothetical protein Droror1_Dr00023977 [Drosera rotundifolia]